MQMFLYNTADSPNVINKKLINDVEININLKSDVNIINPEIVLNGDFRWVNYVYIPDLNRYYIVKSIEQLNRRLVKLYLTCDVLETYKNDILNSEANFNRKINSNDRDIINLDQTNEILSDEYKSSIVVNNDSTTVMVIVGV